MPSIVTVRIPRACGDYANLVSADSANAETSGLYAAREAASAAQCGAAGEPNAGTAETRTRVAETRFRGFASSLRNLDLASLLVNPTVRRLAETCGVYFSVFTCGTCFQRSSRIGARRAELVSASLRSLMGRVHTVNTGGAR